jgi:predicted solute-binding protein
LTLDVRDSDPADIIPLMPKQRTDYRLGAVSFLNTKPLIEGLADQPGVTLNLAVPAELAGMLQAGCVDAALMP